MKTRTLKEKLRYDIEAATGGHGVYTFELVEEIMKAVNDYEQQVKSVDLADVGERYLAIGTLASGKSFRYEDNAVDMRAFANYINAIYPDFEVDAIIAT